MRSVLLTLWLAATLFVVAWPAAATSAGGEVAREPEVLHFRWRLEGVQGFVARVLGVVPTSGEALMTLGTDAQGRLEVRFTATSEKAGDDDHWTYETLVELPEWRTLRVRETYKFRQKNREKDFDLAEREVIDVLSGLQQLRRQPLGATDRNRLWSDGKTYPVEVSSRGTETRELNGRDVAVRVYELRGAKQTGERFWKARAEVRLTADARALPVEMLYRQSLGRLRLTLIEPQPSFD
jgi:hypothetical protein